MISKSNDRITRATILDKINGKPRHSLPPKSRMGKWCVFVLRAPSSLPWGDGALLFHFILSKIAILDKINGKPRPPLPPKSRMGKWRVFALRAPSSLPWGGWGFAVPFYFVHDCRGIWYTAIKTWLGVFCPYFHQNIV